MKKKKMRRIGILFDPYTFESFCKNGRFTITNSPVPKGAKFLGAFYRDENNSFIAYFEHKSFDVVPSGEVIPIKEMKINGKYTEIHYEAIS